MHKSSSSQALTCPNCSRVCIKNLTLQPPIGMQELTASLAALLNCPKSLSVRIRPHHHHLLNHPKSLFARIRPHHHYLLIHPKSLSVRISPHHHHILNRTISLSVRIRPNHHHLLNSPKSLSVRIAPTIITCSTVPYPCL